MKNQNQALSKFRLIAITLILIFSNLAYAQNSPTSANATVSTNEDNDKVFIAGDFPYNDTDGDAMDLIRITSLESTGTLYLDADNDNNIDFGEDVTTNQDINVADIPRLKFRPNTDENGAGYDSFDFRVHEATDGYSPVYTMTIDVTPVNDEPSFTPGGNQTVAEDPGAQTIANWATAIDKGHANENVQTLTFSVSNNNNALFSSQPAISTTGTLTYTPAANANGVATVTVILSDDGGTANGGDDTYPSQNFTITVNAVNDPPTAAANTVTVFENSDYTFAVGNFSYSDVEGDVFNQIETTTVPGNGSLWVDTDSDGTINGAEAALSAGNTVAIADISGSRLKFKPIANENGSPYTTFNFKVHDGTEFSTASYTMTINITAINSEPSFTAGANQTVAEDPGAQTVAAWATSIDKGGTDEGVQTLTFHVTNTNNGLFSAQPDVDETTGDLTYTPAANINGSATVSVYLTDNGGTANGGDDTSPTQNFTITVNAVNDPPTAAANTVTVFENSDYTFAVGNFSYSDVEGDAFNQIETTTVPGNGSLWVDTDSDGTINGAEAALSAGNTVAIADINASRLKFKPVANENGNPNPYTTFDFKVHDGTEFSTGSYTMTINVTSINSEPSFTAGANQTVAEDPGAQTVAAWATSIDKGGTDEGGQTLTFHVTNTNNGLFSAQPDVDETTGDLTYTPAANINGSATVSVYLTDNGGTANGGDDTSPTQNFTITVNAVNDPPTAAANTVTVFENSDYTFAVGNFSYSDVEGDAFNQIETTTVPGNGSLWVDSDSDGTINGAEAILSAGNTVAFTDINASRLKFKPVANENGNPYTTFDFKVHDGTEFSTASYTMTINVTAINSEPSFTKGADQTVSEDAAAQSIANWATSINEGGTDEGGQALTFNLTNDNNGLFSVQPAVSATGTLTYTLTADANGLANVNIYLGDNGGTANGGDDTSPTQSFIITVNAVNDIPVLANNTGKTVLEAAGSQVIANTELQYTDVDNAVTEIIYTLSFVPGNGTLYNNVTALANGNTFTQQDIDNGDINYTHDGGETTTDNFQFTVADTDGGNVPGVQTFTLTITPVNDDPVFTSTEITTGEEGVLYTYNITTTDSDLPADALTLTAPTKPAWLILTDNGDGTGDLSGTPPDGCLRTNSIIININDGSVDVQQSYTLVISYDITVPGNYATIQLAIDNAINGDLITVGNGIYTENINFNGKELEIIGNTANPTLVTIDANGSGAAVIFENGEAGNTTLNGFRIINGTGHSGVAAPFSSHAPSSGYYGAGIFVYQSSPLLKNIIVENNSLAVNNNHGGSGAGIYIGNNSTVTIEGPITNILNNTSNIYRGGGICIDNSTVTIDGAGGIVTIDGNDGGNYGGGISLFESTLNLTDVTIQNNNANGANGSGGGIYSHASTVNQNAGVTINTNSASVGNNNIHTF